MSVADLPRFVPAPTDQTIRNVLVVDDSRAQRLLIASGLKSGSFDVHQAESGAEAMAADLHFLKGAALNLGFSEFASLCASGEARANRGETAGIDPGRIRQAYTVSRHDFLDGLQRRAA